VDILSNVGILLGSALRKFATVTCAAFDTMETEAEYKARSRMIARQNAARGVRNETIGHPGRRQKTYNLTTYKLHAIGDYPASIRRYGTTDSYTTELVSKHFSTIF
jgi:hypothetical protein